MKPILKDPDRRSSSNLKLQTDAGSPRQPVPIKRPNKWTFFRLLVKLWLFLKVVYSTGGEYILEMIRVPSLKSSAVMALGLCFTFVGYEYSRAASITLLAGEETGLGSEALPLTVAVGFPASALTLYLYTKSIKKYGTKLTLRFSNIGCLLIFIISVLLNGRLRGLPAKIFVVCFYAFREIYVSLLSTQQWAFISTSLDKSTSGYLVSFSGIVSIASSVGGCTVVQLVNVGGVRGLLVTTTIATVFGLICAEIADSMSEYEKTEVEEEEEPASAESNCSSSSTSPLPPPSITNPSNTATSNPTTITKSARKSHSTHHSSRQPQHHHHHKHSSVKSNFWVDSWNLISSNYVLRLLFFEALAHQFCSNMLNLMFHNGLRFSMHSDVVKAKVVGRFFAIVNVSASLFQCFVFPMFLNQSTLPYVMRYLPFIVGLAILLGVFRPGAITVMIGFGTIKILEYSVMHSASEMIYMPLGHEIRYLGKELVKFFGQKIGKSVASLSLSVLINQLNLSLFFQSLIGLLLTMFWGFTIFRLSDYLFDKEYKEKKQKEFLFQQNEMEKSFGNRSRTKSEEIRFHKSRSMSLFDIPEEKEKEEEEEILFFRSVSANNLNDQPEDFFYGSPHDISPSSSTDPTPEPMMEMIEEEGDDYYLDDDYEGSDDEHEQEQEQQQEEEEGEEVYYSFDENEEITFETSPRAPFSSSSSESTLRNRFFQDKTQKATTASNSLKYNNNNIISNSNSNINNKKRYPRGPAEDEDEDDEEEDDDAYSENFLPYSYLSRILTNFRGLPVFSLFKAFRNSRSSGEVEVTA